MADRGAIATVRKRHTRSFVYVAPSSVFAKQFLNDPSRLYIDASGTLTVTVRIAGVLKERVHVGVLHRESLQLVVGGFTNSVGEVTFYGLDKDAPEQYAVVAMDPETKQPFNFSQLRDHLSAG